MFQVKYTGGARGGQPERERTRVGHYLKKRMSFRDEFQLKKIGLSYDNPAHFFSCQVRFNFFFYPFYLEGVGMVINLIVLFDCAIVF